MSSKCWKFTNFYLQHKPLSPKRDSYIQLLTQHLHLDVHGYLKLNTFKAKFVPPSVNPISVNGQTFFSCLGEKALESLRTPLSHTHIPFPILQQILLAVSLKTHLLITLSLFLRTLLPPWSEPVWFGLPQWSTKWSPYFSLAFLKYFPFRKVTKVSWSKLSAQRWLTSFGIKLNVFIMSYIIYMIRTSTFSLISSPTSQPLHTVSGLLVPLLLFSHPRHIPQGSWICYFLCLEHGKWHSPCPHFIQVSIQMSVNQRVLPC